MITLSFFGDFLCQNPSQVSYSNAFMNWASADIVACNFEAPVNSNGIAIAKCGPSISQSKDSPKLLTEMGFNVILLANNHIMDYGEEGLKQTLDSFGGIKCIGAGYDSSIYDVYIVEKNSIRVGLISLVHHEFGTVDGDVNSTVGTAWINHPIVTSKIKEARKSCDVLIMLPHAGFENIDAPLPEWREMYKSFIDQGVDIVIASHPHVPQGWEDYKGKRIYYSLGNFCFDKHIGDNPYWNKSLSVKISISDDYKITIEHENVIFDGGQIDIDQSTETQQHNEYLQKLLTPEEYYPYIDAQLEQFWETYKLYLLRGLGAFAFNGTINTMIHSAYGVLKGPDIPMLLDMIQCETHSWAIQRILKNKYNV